VKNAKIVRVAEWDGWCGACAGERPLVLTRTGRQRLRTWLTGAADDSRPLVLTCRLCGTGVDVPLERDDPPVETPSERGEVLAEPTLEAAPAPQVPVLTAPPVQASAPAVPGQPPSSVPSVQASAQGPSAELIAGRQAVAQALGALLGQRSAAGAVPQPAPGPVEIATAAPVLPQQRTATTGALAELQLLADGIDLLSSGRA
jgi:hypothetical protein